MRIFDLVINFTPNLLHKCSNLNLASYRCACLRSDEVMHTRVHRLAVLSTYPDGMEITFVLVVPSSRCRAFNYVNFLLRKNLFQATINIDHLTCTQVKRPNTCKIGDSRKNICERETGGSARNLAA